MKPKKNNIHPLRTKGKIIFPVLLVFTMISMPHSLKADPPDPPVGKVWVLNPLMSDEFGPIGPNTDVFNIYTRDRSWDRTAAFDPKAIRMEKDSADDTNYFLTMNPLWYYEDEVFTKESIGRTFTFAGGAMDTKNLQTYGYYEVRIRPSDFPFGSGVFMNSRGNPATVCEENYSTELDIIENMGYTGPGAGEMDSRGGFFNHVQHVNSHTKGLKYVDDEGNCIAYQGWDAWDSRGADSYELDDPHAFFTVGMWWENSTTVHFYNNDRHFSSLEPAREFKIPMALILSMETYTTAGSDENNAGNPKPQEWMWEEDFRTRDQRAVKYDWVRTWYLVDIDSSEFNDQQDNIRAYQSEHSAYMGEKIDATLIYSATVSRTITATLLSPTKEMISDTTFSVTKGVRSIALAFSSDSITATGDDYCIAFTIEDESSVLASDSVQISITEEPLTKRLYAEGIPTSLEPASSINLAVKYQADTVCKLVVEVHKPNGDGLSWDSKVVQPGNGVANFYIELSSALEYGTDYYFKIYMFRNGMNWQDPQTVSLGNLYFNVEDVYNSSISILNIDSVFLDDKTIDVEFSYATKSDGSMAIVLLDRDNRVVASEYREERYGNRTITRTMEVDSSLNAGDLYKALIIYTPENPDFVVLKDSLTNIEVYDTASVTQSINSKFLNEEVKLFPNPSSGTVYLNLSKGMSSTWCVEVFDATGTMVLLQTKDIRTEEFVIDISALKNGTYIVRISSEDEIYTNKLVKIQR